MRSFKGSDADTTHAARLRARLISMALNEECNNGYVHEEGTGARLTIMHVAFAFGRLHAVNNRVVAWFSAV